jgi:hypothetical protein
VSHPLPAPAVTAASWLRVFRVPRVIIRLPDRPASSRTRPTLWFWPGAFLVVLAALAAAWAIVQQVQARDQVDRERAFLVAVRQALLENRVNVESIHDVQVQVMAAADRFLALPGTAAPDDIYGALHGIMNTRPYDPAFAVYAPLLTSPQAALVPDLDVAAAIATYARRFADAAATKRDADAQWDKIARPLLYTRLDWARLAGEPATPGAPPARADDPVLRNVILDRRAFANDVLKQSEQLLLEAGALRSLLAEALRRLPD